MPASRTTLPSRSTSDAISLANSSGVLVVISTACAATLLTTSGACAALMNSSLSVAHDRGRACRAARRCLARFQARCLGSRPPPSSVHPAAPASAWSRSSRAAAACRLPPARWPRRRKLNRKSTLPATRSFTAGPAPRYGTCCIGTPDTSRNISPRMWPPEPTPCERVVEAARLGLGECDEFLGGLGRRSGRHHQHAREREQRRDRRKSLTGSKRMSARQRRHDREHAVVGEKQRVAVGRCLLERDRRRHAAAAAAVVDHDVGLEIVGKLLRDQARHHVRAAARRERHDDRDRARGKVRLRERDRLAVAVQAISVQPSARSRRMLSSR